MLTSREKAGLQRLLMYMDLTDLFALANTVCQKRATSYSREGAIDIIIKYTIDAIDVLKRQKMHRDLLFRYLQSVHVPVGPKTEKTVLIHEILQYWGSSSPSRSLMQQEIIIHQTPPPRVSEPIPRQQDIVIDRSDATFANQFCSWFYQMLNAYHPHHIDTSKQEFGPQHFFSDGELKVYVSTNNSMETYNGSHTISSRLLAFVTEELVMFNPNLEPDGLKIQTDPHGLKLILVCGTVHSGASVVGMFEQKFGLVKDMTDGNAWKVKFTHLKLSVGATSGMPTLKDTGHLAINQ